MDNAVTLWRRGILLALGLILVASCEREGALTKSPATAPQPADDTPREGGTLYRRLESDIVTVNPVMATSAYDRYVDFYLFTPLVHLDKSLLEIPALAESWTISPDGRRYTFKLNPKATFSDGTPVRASDVLFTLRKIVDPQSEAVQIAGGFEHLDLRSTKVLDPHTIEIAFREPTASQMMQFNNVLVLPEHVYSKGDFETDFQARAVGSGPYTLKRRESGKEVVLERREDYWDTRPYIKTVVFKVVENEATAWNGVKRGDIDETTINSDIWKIESRRPAANPNVELRRFYRLTYNYIAWNGRDPIFKDKRVRSALAKSIDLGSLINNVYAGTARAMTGPFTPDQWAYNPQVAPIPYDPAATKRELTSLGWLDTNGDGVLDKDGKPFEFEMFIVGRSVAGGIFAQTYQEELKKIGVVMKPTLLDPAMLIQRVLGGKYQSAYLAIELDPDPDPFAIFHSSQFPPRGQNFVYYANPEADRLMNEGRRELDRAKRTEIYHRLHEILAHDQPYTWTVQVSPKWAINKRVRGVEESKGWGFFNWYPGELGWWLAK